MSIQLFGTDADKYDVYYKCSYVGKGWQDWLSNGESYENQRGTGKIEAIKIMLLSKGARVADNIVD